MPHPVFVLKVALAGNKGTWRRIGIRGDQTLDDLHEAIFRAFDRDDEHLYSFYFPKPGSKGRARIRNAIEYACPLMAEDNQFGSTRAGDAAKVEMGSLGLEPRRKFHYLFDFGDEWWHDITVQNTDAKVEGGEYPRVLEKHGESPPQYPDSDDMDEW